MTHRRTLFAALMLLGAGGTFAQSGFTITGRVPGVKDSTVVRLMNIEDEGRRGKLVTQGICLNGGFHLEGRVTSPTLCRVEILGTHAYEDGQSFQTETETCMMVENVPMTMEVAHLDSLPLTYEYGHSPLEKEMNATVSGGTEQTAYVTYRRALHDAELRTWRLDRMCLDLKFDKAGCADSLPVWQARLRSMQQEVAERTDAFIRSHPQASISACLVEQKLKKPFTLSADEIDAWVTCVQGMPDTVRLSRIRELAGAAKVYATGQPFKDFVLTDTLKQTVALSVARRPGVYTLVDFWASWCAPCRASIPHLKELYKAQSGRLDILSVSVDRKEADWHKAMREEQMPWRQYTVTSEVSKQLGDLYQLHSIPFLLLLDPDGRIVVGTHSPDEVDAALL